MNILKQNRAILLRDELIRKPSVLGERERLQVALFEFPEDPEFGVPVLRGERGERVRQVRGQEGSFGDP